MAFTINMDEPIIFSESDRIIYKQILLREEANQLNDLFINLANEQNYNSNIVTGTRYHINFSLRSQPELVERLITVLKDQFCDLEIDPNARFYSHQLGGIKPHTDSNHDNVCKYTLLLYLTDNFDDGKLSIKIKRTEAEKLLEQADKHHKVFTFTPKQGYGVIFDKSHLHWANEIYEGEKNFLLIHLNSSF
jgi:hypothetical protein